MDAILSINPRTGLVQGAPVPTTSPDALDERVRRAASSSSAWSGTTGGERATALDDVAAALEASEEELVDLAEQETALGEPRLRGELQRTVGQLRFFGDVLRDGSYVDAILSPPDPDRGRPDVRRMLVPIGPVAVFAASNFPFAFSVAGGDTASALAAGCAVVVKAHEGHPRTSLRTGEVVAAALEAAGAPPDCLTVVFGFETGRRLVEHPSVTAVGFTGSSRGGRALADLAARRARPIPFFGELGAANPVVVLPRAAREREAEIAQGYADSLTMGNGQFCTKPGLLMVPGGSGIVDAVGRAVSGRMGQPMLTETMHRTFVAATQEEAWSRLPLLARGTGGGHWVSVPEARVLGLETFAPSVAELAEEHFGPAGLVVTYDSLDDLLPVLGRLPGSLAAAVHATDEEADAAQRVGDALARVTGRLVMNGWPTGVSVCSAMHHGGPWPATTNAAATSVGAAAIRRWLVPVAYQDWPDALLPLALQQANPLGIARTVRP